MLNGIGQICPKVLVWNPGRKFVKVRAVGATRSSCLDTLDTRHLRFPRMAVTTRAAVVAYSRASSLLGEMPIECTTLFLIVCRSSTIPTKASSSLPAATNARANCLGDLLWNGDIGTSRPSAKSVNSLSMSSQDSIIAPRGYVSAISWILSSIEGGS